MLAERYTNIIDYRSLSSPGEGLFRDDELNWTETNISNRTQGGILGYKRDGGGGGGGSDVFFWV